MKAVLKFIKKEPIMIAAVILAVVTCFFVPPNLEYLDYINFKTLTTIFSLSIIIKALNKINTFKILATKILPLIKSSRGLVTALVFLPTILALFITNDVAVLTFVPFALIILNMCDIRALRWRGNSDMHRQQFGRFDFAHRQFPKPLSFLIIICHRCSF